MAVRIKVLFLCIGNSCRSQMAEAIAKHLASDVIEPSSAGLLPFGEIIGPTAQVLKERGILVEGQYSKALRPGDLAAADLVINMTGSAGGRILQDPMPPIEDWDIGDPYGFNLAVFRKIRHEIEAHVNDLAGRLRAKVDSQKTA
jgi:arsenate reductase